MTDRAAIIPRCGPGEKSPRQESGWGVRSKFTLISRLRFYNLHIFFIQAIGFCRASDAPEHQLRKVTGRTGLVQFWDCCGSEKEGAPGCCFGKHVTYDDPDD
jgi:hypothetical protein